MNEKKTRIVLIVTLCIAFLGLSVAYATLNSNFSVAGTSTVKGGNWTVGISNVGNVTKTGQAVVTTQPALSVSTVSFAVDLKLPGDSVSFDITVANTGTLDAKLSALTLTGVSEATAANVSYTVTPKDGVTTGSVLAKTTGTHVYTVTVTYLETASTISESDVVLNLGASIEYVQN